ncbi:phage holin [Trueperella pyogenes]
MDTVFSPQLRSWMYGISVALIPLLVTAGVLAGDSAQQVLNLVAAVLGLGNAGLATAYRPTKADGEHYDGIDQ